MFLESFNSNLVSLKFYRFAKQEQNAAKTIYVSKIICYDNDNATIKKQAI